MAMEFFAFLALGSLMETQFLEGVWKKIELLKNIWAFIFEIHYWLNYHKHLDKKVQTLKEKMEALRCRECDVETQVKNAEQSNPRNMRRREVKNWLENVQRKKDDVQSIEQSNRAANFLLRAWLGSQIEKNIQELDELLRQGEFPVGLVLESHQTREPICQHTLLDSQKGTLEKIWASVMNDEVLIVGVHGIAGVGKTTITEHIYNRLIECHDFDHVYWVTVLPEWEIVELQDKIAREIGLDFDEKDENKGKAKLYQAFKIRKKTLLILDGVSKYFPLDKVGISNQVNGNGCKVILTTRSLKVCRKMAYTYREIIEVEPLPLDEAEKLFMEVFGRPIDHCALEIKQCAELIVRECRGLPLAITTTAVNLRGVDSISEWRNELNELREVENGIQD